MELRPSSNYKYVFLNSLILFVIANILVTILHESAHFITAINLDVPDVSLHHNYVQYDGIKTPIIHRIYISAAGPLISLLIGIFFQVLCNLRSRNDLLFMFENYMSIFGYIGFFGYLMVAPFFADGDTGYIFQALSFPLWLVILIALLSFVMLYIFMVKLTRNFVLICPIEALEMDHSRAQFMTKTVLLPVIIGIFIITILNLPVLFPLSLIAPIMSPFTILWTYPIALKRDYPGMISNLDFDKINRFSPTILTGLLAIILINRLLVLGFQF